MLSSPLPPSPTPPFPHSGITRSPARPLARSESPLLLVLLALAVGVAFGIGVVVANPLYVVAGVLAVGIGLALLASIQFALLAFVAVATLLPFGVIPVRLGVQLTLIDALLLVLLFTWIVRILLHDQPLELTAVGGLVIAYVGVMGAAFVLGTAYQSDPELARRVLKLINSVLFFFVAANCIRQRWQVDQLVRALMVGGFLSAAFGVALALQPPETILRVLSSLRVVGYPAGGEVLRFLPGPGDTYTDTLRATSTSVDPNVLGGLLMVSLLLVVSQAAARRPLLPRLLLAPMGLVMLACLVLTYSRSSWVGLAAGVAYLATFRYRRAWVFGFLALAVLMYLPIGQEVLERMEQGLTGQDKATVMRFSEYRNALEIILRYPWLGIGFGAAPSIDLYPGVSSLYLLIAQQSGLIGLGLFLATVGVLFVRSVRALVASPDADHRILLLGLQAVFVAALLAGLFDHYFANQVFPHMVALFWFLLALLWRASSLLAAQPPSSGEGASQGREPAQGDVEGEQPDYRRGVERSSVGQG